MRLPWWTHEGLRLATPAGETTKWRERTPAMAAGLTDHQWTLREVLSHPIPPPAWVAPNRRGRPPKPRPQPEIPVAA